MPTFGCMRATPCFCGSGRDAAACHEMPRRERRRQRRSLLTLAETHDVAFLFPWVRPEDQVFDAFAERVARLLAASAPPIPPAVVEDGVALLGRDERRRIVDGWAERYPDRWQSVAADAGDVALAERVLVASAVRGAIVERLPARRGLLEMIETMPPSMSPCGVLGILIEPLLVWNRDDAIMVANGAGSASDPQRFIGTAHRLADSRVEPWQVDRVRELADRIRARLPIAGLPRASRLIEEGCDELDGDDEAAHGLASVLLAFYAHAVVTHDLR
jgi:hypothetical protein